MIKEEGRFVMFVAFASFILGAIVFVAMYDWIYYVRPSPRFVQKTLKHVSQHISIQAWECATKQLQPLLENGKGGKEGALYEIQILRGKGQWEEALVKLKLAHATYPEERLFYLEEGSILLKLDKCPEALAAFQLCVSLMRQSDLLDYATALLRTNQPQACLEVLARISHTFSDSSHTLHDDLAVQMDEAVLLEHCPHPSEQQSQSAERRSVQKKCEKCGLARISHTFSDSSHTPHDDLASQEATSQDGALVALAADAFYEMKQFQNAIDLYRHAIAIGNASHRILIQLGNAYRRLGNLAEAEKMFQILLHKDPSDIEATLGIGACLQERGQYTKAFLVYQTGLSWSRELRLLFQAAYTALRTKRYTQAERYFFEVLQRHEADPQTFAYYGLSLELQKKWQEAEQHYLKLITLFPSSPHGYRALAWMFGVGLSQTIDQEAGLHFAYKALKLQDDPISLEILSACAARNGHFDKAYQIQLALAKQDKDPKAHMRRQQALRTLRKKMPLYDELIVRSRVA
jgi:tetratricopeptide (TPR) repeat protein